MKAPFSPYLMSLRVGLKRLLALLCEKYEYASILATDSRGFSVRVSTHAKTVGRETMTTERGIVIRVMKEGLYAEYALNDFDPVKPEEGFERADKAFEAMFASVKETGTKVYATPAIPDEPLDLFVEKEAKVLPEQADMSKLLASLCELPERAQKRDARIVECMAGAQSTHICKMFLSKHRDLCQSYVYSEGAVVAVAQDNDRNRDEYASVSGLCGPEIFEKLPQLLDDTVDKAIELLSAESVEPGEYDVIASPEVSGLIAHEAFGHGVEMDMFVKDRALGREYIGKRVGSDLCTMHEGALCAENVTSYAFDDEGTLAGDVTEIDHGILISGICDALSAVRLGVRPTGNGKRENFEHKAYTRMTNTVFDSGTSTLDEMIASIKHGYLLEGMESGMEDPKHWGIQCVIKKGREIVDGKLTGKVASPIIMTGYVPDLLGSISAASSDREIFGSGGCGKGHKEWVKVADGGPYLKMKARLG